MSGSRCIADTSIIISLFMGDQLIVKAFDKLALVYLPVVSLGELYAGAYLSDERDFSFGQIEGILKKMRLLNIDQKTAMIFGHIRTELRKKGKPIPENDVWIAALAKQHQLPLITSDKHFREVKGIKVRYW